MLPKPSSGKLQNEGLRVVRPGEERARGKKLFLPRERFLSPGDSKRSGRTFKVELSQTREVVCFLSAEHGGRQPFRKQRPSVEG